MKLTPAVVVTVLAATSAFAQGQIGNPTTKRTIPNTVDIQKVVRSIIGDKTKIKAYCDLAKLYEQMADAEAKNDTKAVGALSLKAQAQLDMLGSDYAKFLDAVDQTGPDFQEGKKIAAALDTLDGSVISGPSNAKWRLMCASSSNNIRKYPACIAPQDLNDPQ